MISAPDFEGEGFFNGVEDLDGNPVVTAVPEPTGGKEITRWFYTSSDGRQLAIEVERGLIAPPSIEIHNPLVGPIFYHYQRSQS
jgi:hypothetical protein